jgi:hypothetical protein
MLHILLSRYRGPHSFIRIRGAATDHKAVLGRGGSTRAQRLGGPYARWKGAPELVLIHVEIQREREARFPWRMWQYYALLRQREDVPVIPIALVLYPGREGIALEVYAEEMFGRTYLTFRYLQISLPRLEAAEYITDRRPVGRRARHADAFAHGTRGADRRASGWPATGAAGPGGRTGG